ncbi:sigma-70 family RNA polymerase sigma factor [Ferrimicrobium sp.]|uniref:sigma-70 family RNA polymerase sigma factor n=1 Tax=Ferrimicrobium sp. TaxID=2926050 RepID=UPI00261DBAAE|nr:sigma-70 family RNA polymerase sigma factor [Ferrimicrobium sp.]
MPSGPKRTEATSGRDKPKKKPPITDEVGTQDLGVPVDTPGGKVRTPSRPAPSSTSDDPIAVGKTAHDEGPKRRTSKAKRDASQSTPRKVVPVNREMFPIDEVHGFLASLAGGSLLSREDEVQLSAIVQELQGRDQLTPEEQRILVAAKERFVAANLRLVASIARRMHGGGAPLEDLIQEGNIGLMRAVELYDGRKGFRFSTYATWWIRQAISQAIGEFRNEISLPRSLQQDFQRIQAVRLDLQQKLGREPRLDEVAEACGLELFRVEEIMMYAQTVLSLEAGPITDSGSESMLGDAVPDRSSPPLEETVASQDLGRVVQLVLDQLEERERSILVYRFGLNGEEPHSIEQASERFGVSRERVRQVEARAISRLRRNELTQALKEVLRDG